MSKASRWPHFGLRTSRRNTNGLKTSGPNPVQRRWTTASPPQPSSTTPAATRSWSIRKTKS